MNEQHALLTSVNASEPLEDHEFLSNTIRVRIIMAGFTIVGIMAIAAIMVTIGLTMPSG
jgi:hypothetical protein